MSKKDKCKKYELAITDYVLGEKMDISKEDLVKHLKQCKSCRADLDDWQNTHAALKAEEYHNRPEVKARWEAFIKELTTGAERSPGERRGQPLPDEQPIDAKWDVGSAAGKIYEYLKTTGKVPKPVIRKETGLVNYPFYEAIGWLIKEEKVILSKDEQTVYVSLTEREREQRQI